jgi:hypothetical protein
LPAAIFSINCSKAGAAGRLPGTLAEQPDENDGKPSLAEAPQAIERRLVRYGEAILRSLIGTLHGRVMTYLS